jgi:tetratricopeptide (TPR) repeat protein
VVDEARFQEAQRALAAKDYRAAAEGFLAAADGPGGPGNGEALHLAGNALMKLRKYQNAVTVYQHALNDPTYDKVTSVLVNLATAEAALGEYADAVGFFNAALADEAYPKRYKVLQGRAGALYAMGRYDEAASDYIAAVGPGNPDRGRAFNNLGLALAAAGKPAEAIEAHKAALATDGYEGKGKAAANLGLACAALGRHEEAVAAFEGATQAHGHKLNDTALEAYEASKRALDLAPKREVVDGWRTGEMPAVVAGPSSTAADDEEADGESAVGEEPAVEIPVSAADADTGFFTRSDEEMKELDRKVRRQERAERRASTNPWARAAAVALLVIAVVGGSAGVFFAGYGFPTQRQIVSGMLAAYKSGRPVTDYWVAAPPSDVVKEMATIPPTFAGETVDSVERSAFTSKVKVTVKLEKGAPLRYRISLSREGVGWKVVGIDNDWGATGGS